MRRGGWWMLASHRTTETINRHHGRSTALLPGHAHDTEYYIRMNEMHNEHGYITINEAMLSQGVFHRILDHNLMTGQLNI